MAPLRTQWLFLLGLIGDLKDVPCLLGDSVALLSPSSALIAVATLSVRHYGHIAWCLGTS